MADSPPAATDQEDNCTPYLNDVYAATPSSGSGGGAEEEEENEKVSAERIQPMETINNYLQTPNEDTSKKVSEWVTQAATYTADNPTENGEGHEVALKSENMEQDNVAYDEGQGIDTNENGESDSKQGQDEPNENSPTTFKIFVSNLPPGLLSSELKELFQQHGEVVECEIFAKNYAFVHMVSEEVGMNAMEQLRNYDLKGCKINVKRSVHAGYPLNKTKKEPVEPEPEVPVEGLEVGTFKIYITNLPEDVTKEYVKELLEPFGRAVEIEIYRNTSAFVHMEKEQSGKKAIEELSGQTLPECEKPLSVSISKNPEGPQSVPTIKLMVKNVSTTILADELRDLFIPYGLVLKVVISPKVHPNGCRTAIVHLEQFGNIRSAIKELSGKELGGSAIHVEATFDKPEKPKAVQKPQPKPHYKPTKYPLFNRPAPRPLLSVEEPSPWPRTDFPPTRPPFSHASEWGPPPANKMRLIPMPSEADLKKFPKSSRGRRLLPPPRPPPPLMAQHTFNSHSPWEANDGYNNNHSYDEVLDHGFGGGYSNYNEGEEYNEYEEFDWSQAADYAPPPLKIPRNNKSWNNSRNFGGNQNAERHNKNSNKNFNKRPVFPELPTSNEFPKVPQSLMSVQIPKAEDCDWTADNFSWSSDFVTNESGSANDHGTSSLNCVPFDYSKINSKKQFSKNSYPQAKSNNKNKHGGKVKKSRRPGLGTHQQQKKLAHQTGTEEGESSNTNPGDFWQPVSGSTGNNTETTSSSSQAPYYFQQKWPVKNRNDRKPTSKQIKQAEEDQKKQYADYLKLKPWLYQAIPGTVKKVQK